jgi:stearoyl-CoA desaturase (delta-9 desaturase)
MFYGLIDLPWWGYIAVALIFTHVTTTAVTLYLHRYSAHRGLELSPVVSHFFRLWLWLSTGMHTKSWTAIHRKHHSRCETDEDPHSPKALGLKTVFWYGAELYRKESKNQETLERYGQGTPDDWMERKIYTPLTKYGVFTMMAINIVLFGVPGITLWAFQMFWIPFTAAGIVNGIGHAFGYRNFECADASRNVSPIGIFLCGEELHNNHHTFGTSAKFSVKWWEFDIGWMYITILSAFGLAKAKRVAPKVHIVNEKAAIDIDTVKAVITNRFEVLAEYARDVIKPVLREHKQALGADDSLVRRSILRDKIIVDESSLQSLQKVLEAHPTLAVVYNFREQLQAIWARSTASQKELLEALQEWCRQAESTGIAALAEFARSIKKYSLPQALA